MFLTWSVRPPDFLQRIVWENLHGPMFFNYHDFKWKCFHPFYLSIVTLRFYRGSIHTSIFSVEQALSLRTRYIWLLAQSEKQRHAPPEVHMAPWVKGGVEAQAANLPAVWTVTDAGQVHEEASVDQILCEAAWPQKKEKRSPCTSTVKVICSCQ